MTSLISYVIDKKKISPDMFQFFTKSNDKESLCFEYSIESDLFPRGSDMEAQAFDFSPDSLTS